VIPNKSPEPHEAEHYNVTVPASDLIGSRKDLNSLLPQMKPPRSLKISDMQVGTGRKVVPGDVAICHCICTRRKDNVVFASPSQEPYVIRVGARDSCVGIEYGLLGMQIGGVRTVKVPPNLTYIERKIYIDIPEDAMLVYELKLINLPEKWDSDMASRLTVHRDERRQTKSSG